MNLNSPGWRTPEVFDDGEALCKHELEGRRGERS
jgi:hypothetical protein